MRLRSGDKHHPRKSADRKAQISPVSETNAFLICALRSADFLAGGVYPPSAASRTIYFSISNSFLYSSVLFIPSLVRVGRPCRGLEKFFPPVVQRCYGCSFHAREIVHTGHGMLGYFCFFFFWRERCLPKVS